MSLLNDMLKDLDGHGNAAHDLGESTPKTATKRFRKSFFLPVLALIAVSYFLLVELNLVGLFPKTPQPSIEIPQPVKLNSKWLTGAGQVAESAPMQGNSETDQVKSTPRAEHKFTSQKLIEASEPEAINHRDTAKSTDAAVTPDTVADKRLNTPDNQLIQELLKKSRYLIAEDKLMTPLGENAYQYLRSVISVDPENRAANELLDQIKSRYILLANRAAKTGKDRLARTYLDRAKTVGPVNDQLVQSIVDTSSAQHSGSQATPHNVVKPTEPKSDAEVAQLLRRQYNKSRAREVIEAIERGEPRPLSLLALAEIHFNARDVDSLTNLLAMTPKVGLQSLVKGQIKVIQGDYSSAKSLLEQRSVHPEVEWVRLRLLSAACQKLKDFDCAKHGYAQLVSSPQVTGKDWLGLAVSLDGAGEFEQAIRAYNQVIRDSSVSPRVKSYASSRVTELSSQSYLR